MDKKRIRVAVGIVMVLVIVIANIFVWSFLYNTNIRNSKREG